ncbi:uncharacterized protein [Triticum aestivum]|uniref:uncharacterized protein n=1 Tax=Triticum aestivum TaxID=4565 RepID=UPI001ABD0E49|nr:uncharacterized protein LOC120969845 [Aegilops tauschii subsp. strangulata]XP_044437316.1 uncharacterized protein LOC123163976 [Triticum aestivum]
MVQIFFWTHCIQNSTFPRKTAGAEEGERMEGLAAPTTMDGAAAVIFMWIRCHLPIFPNGVQQSGSDQNARSEVGSRLVGGVPESSLAVDLQGGELEADDANSKNRAPAESGESAIKPDPQAPGWIKS